MIPTVNNAKWNYEHCKQQQRKRNSVKSYNITAMNCIYPTFVYDILKLFSSVKIKPYEEHEPHKSDPKRSYKSNYFMLIFFFFWNENQHDKYQNENNQRTKQVTPLYWRIFIFCCARIFRHLEGDFVPAMMQ